MRIVAGEARGRRLAGPAARTRPTSDRAREAMFNSLQAATRLAGARVLDLFAGTGAVGLEALSRGAGEAVFVESDRAALAVLHRNIEAVGLRGASVVARSVAGYLAGPAREFDLVVADPPYALPDADIAGMLRTLSERGWLASGAFVVVERAARSVTDAYGDDLLTPVRERRYGDSLLWYGRRR
jgi:16S rRNA (guanine966-N2)-methyltransferase